MNEASPAGRGVPARGALPLLLVTVFLNIAGFSLLLPLLPFYGAHFGASPPAVASLFAAYSLGNVFGEIFWGRRSDIVGRRGVLITTTACAALGYVAFAFAPTLAWAILVRVITGFFSGTMGVVVGVIADITPAPRRARNMGYFGAAFNLGLAVGPAMGGLLADPAAGLPGFRIPIFVAAGLTALASVWATLVLPETRPAGGAVRAAPRYAEAFAFVRGEPVLWRLFLIAFCGIGAFASMEAVFGLWTERHFGWTSREVGLAFVAVGGAGLCVQTLLIGPLVARFGEPRVILAGLLLLVVAIGLPPVLRLPAASVALMSLLMVGHSLAFPNAGALVSRCTPPDRQGSVMGLNMASNAVSRIVVPPFFGWIYTLGPDAPYLLCALLVAAMVPVALRVIALRRAA